MAQTAMPRKSLQLDKPRLGADVDRRPIIGIVASFGLAYDESCGTVRRAELKDL